MENSKKLNKNVLIAVAGGIAAYKTAEICSQLIKKGFNVQVMMTSAAKEFVSPLTFETISQNPVTSEMFERSNDWDVAHISTARWADVVLICPATANIIGKMANGICDDFVTTTLTASKALCLIAPAMNTSMYQHPAVQRNLQRLKDDGYGIISPESGRLACEEIGEGKLANIEEIIARVVALAGVEAQNSDDPGEIHKGGLAGKTVLVTAGATREHIDPVRFLSNPSSGKMGIAVAEAALEKGARVILITGHSTYRLPSKAEVVPVHSSQEMYEKVFEYLEESDIVVKTAAVSDFRPKVYSDIKIKKDCSEETYSLPLVRTPDILKEIGENKRDKIVVGFAAETDDIIKNAREKLKKKNVDLMIVNDISSLEAGFNSDYNTVKILYPSGEIKEMPSMTKIDLGKKIIEEIEMILNSSTA